MGWVFNNANIDAYDLTSAWNYDPANNFGDRVGSNPGTNFGTTDVAGKNDRGRKLVAASSQYMDFGNGANLVPTTGFTLAIWAAWSGAVGVSQAVMGKHDNNNKRSYLLHAVTTNALRGIISSDGSNAAGKTSVMTTNNNVIVPGGFQLVIISFGITDGVIHIYVDDVDESNVGTTNANAIATFADVSFAIGATHATGIPANFLNADVDEGMYWRNQILNAAARSALWNGGSGLFLKQQPTVDSFVAIPSEVVNGTDVLLRWRTSNATVVSIDQGVGAVAADGSMIVNPLDTTLYTITATGPGGVVTATALVTVGDGALAADNIRRVLGRYRRPRR